MVDAGRSIPGRPHIEFGIGVVGEHFAVGIEGDAERIAQSGGDDFLLAGGGIEADEMSLARRAGGRGSPGPRVQSCADLSSLTYPQYSVNFFDGRHYVMKGASPVTARTMIRRSFRNWFFDDYPYMYAKFRCVAAR